MEVHLQIIPYDFDEQALGNVSVSMIRDGRLSTIRMNKADVRTLLTNVFKSQLLNFSNEHTERYRRDIGHGTATSRSRMPTNRISRGAGSASSRQTAIASWMFSMASSTV